MRLSEKDYVTNYLLPCMESFEKKGEENTPEEFGSLIYWATLPPRDIFLPYGGIDRRRKERRDNARKQLKELPYGLEVLMAEIHYLEHSTYVI